MCVDRKDGGSALLHIFQVPLQFIKIIQGLLHFVIVTVLYHILDSDWLFQLGQCSQSSQVYIRNQK